MAFTTTTAGDYVLKLTNTGNFYFTDVEIKEVAPVTLDNYGYATYSSALPLKLSDLPETLKAYTAERSGATIGFNRCRTDVPAGTGLLLKGSANTTYYIPVVGSASDVAGNALTASTTSSVAYTDLKSVAGTTYYFAMKKDVSPLTFLPISTSSTVRLTNKAYFVLDNTDYGKIGAGARPFTIYFDDEADGIVQVQNDVLNMNGGTYDMQGRKLSTDKGTLRAGLYIVNGKKVLVK